MYAVIRTGGKQARVQEGDVIDVERLRGGEEVSFQALLIVGDDGTVVSDKDALAKATVEGKVTGEHRGRKVEVFHFRNKSGYRKTQGHRQTYSQVEITKIDAPGVAKSAPAKKAPAQKPPAKTPAAKQPAAKSTAAKGAQKPAAAATAKASAAKKTTAAKTPTAKKATTASKTGAKAKRTTAAKSAAKKAGAAKSSGKKSPRKKDE
jgi:large subunit ribosomal protein L21